MDPVIKQSQGQSNQSWMEFLLVSDEAQCKIWLDDGNSVAREQSCQDILVCYNETLMLFVVVGALMIHSKCSTPNSQ